MTFSIGNAPFFSAAFTVGFGHYEKRDALSRPHEIVIIFPTETGALKPTQHAEICRYYINIHVNPILTITHLWTNLGRQVRLAK